ncbi:hypothetical protein E9840_11270 [Tissierella creatinini]|nr:hypothetical protein E9840_11270 [Tissierella creatinini]TJX62915.1 hypothetical protein E8P77_16325 [Soehngenia saccharolytica]
MANLYEQLNDLYKLQKAACELKHGILNRGWKLYEPSRFVYAFFAFNSFYSINWEESQNQKELVNWDSNDMSETKKIREMQKYIFSYYVKEGQSKKDKENAEKELGDKFILIVNNYLGVNIKDRFSILDNIILDKRVNESERDKFLRSISKPVNEGYLSKKIWDNILYFIYLVRNNVFHGSKTITHMSGSEQIERFKIYTAILLATNELLFEVIEDNFEWINEDKRKRIVIDNNQNSEQQVIKASLDETLYSKYKIKVPEGILFYPCCGDDTFEPIKLFIDTVSEYHFVDTRLSILLPILECTPGRANEETLRPQGFSERHIIPSSIIKSLDMRGIEQRKLNNKAIDQLKELDIEIVGRIYNETRTEKQEWIYAPDDDQRIQVCRHKQNGLVKFMDFDKIAVFFFRGDSIGEGGSGQGWLQVKIFDLIIGKLVDGGFIVSDGSGYYDDFDDVPWKPLFKKDNSSWDSDLERPKDFSYKNRRFTCIGECGERYGTVYLWKVDLE